MTSKENVIIVLALSEVPQRIIAIEVLVQKYLYWPKRRILLSSLGLSGFY